MKTVFHAGDKVRIVTPDFVVRVGYPKAVADYEEVAQKLLDSTVAAAFPVEAAELNRFVWRKGRSSHFFDRAVRAYARWMAEVDGFGGPVRSVHSLTVPALAGAEGTVQWLRTAATGEYYPPTKGSGYNSFSGDYDEGDLGGLADQKSHRIAAVGLQVASELEEVLKKYNRRRGPAAFFLAEYEVEVCNLEMVERGSGGTLLRRRER